MASINLLPEDMRGKELKELKRRSKKLKASKEKLSSVQENKPIKKVKKPRKALFGGLFSRKKKKSISMTQGITPLARQATRVDLLSAAKKQKMNYRPVPRVKTTGHKKSLWGVVGPAKSPIKPVLSQVVASKVLQPKKDIPQMTAKPILPVKLSSGPVSVRPKKSGLFVRLFGKKKKRPISQSVPVAKQKKVKSERKLKEKFHVVPKAEKSKLDINLVPEELVIKMYPNAVQQIVGIILAIAVPAFLVFGVYVLIDSQQNIIEKKIVQATNDQNELIDFIDGFQNIQKDNIRMQDKLLAVSKLLEKHIYWTKFFSLLERYTLNEVYYTEFTADTSGEFMLPAVASIGIGSDVKDQVASSYQKAAQQIVAFQQADDFVDEIRVDNLEIVFSDKAGVKGVKFDLNIGLIDGVFLE